MKIIDRYIIREVTMAFFGVLFISTIIMLVYRVVEVFEEILQNSPDFIFVILYFINILPFDLIQLLPASLAIAVLLSVGYMAKSNEVLALFSSGVSPIRLALPILAFSILISLVMFYLNEVIVPETQYRARYIERAYIEGKGKRIKTKSEEVYQKGRGKRFYSMRVYDSEAKIMTDVSIIELDPDNKTFKWRFDADRAEFIGGPKNNLWRFYGAHEWSYTTNEYVEHTDAVDMELEERADEFLGLEHKPEEMNIVQLGNLISLLKSTGEETRPFRSEWQMKIAYPLSNVIIALFCCALAIRANFRTLMIGFALGLFMTIAFYCVVMFFRMLGQTMILPPILSAWGANLIFGVAGMLLLVKRA